MIPKIANYPIHVYVCLWYVVTFYYTFKYAFRLPLSVIGRRHGGPGEVTHSRLEDDGMRHRYVSYIILLFDPALCIRYIWSTSIHRYTVGTFSVILHCVSIRSYLRARAYYNNIIICAQDIPLFSRSPIFTGTTRPRWLYIYYDERTAANYIIGWSFRSIRVDMLIRSLFPCGRVAGGTGSCSVYI